jgi:hypothetical protein
MSVEHLTNVRFSQVIDYLAKKGYTRTEAMLRMESASQEIDGRPLPQLGEDSRPKYRAGFGGQCSSALVPLTSLADIAWF